MNKDNVENGIQKAIKEVIAFFDLFDYPLSSAEVWRYCFLKCSQECIEKELLQLEEVRSIEEKDGFYFLPRREGIIRTRKDRLEHSARKFRKAGFIVKIFKIIPWIKMAAVGNIIGKNNLKDESDIDLFIITEKNRIWLTRLFCNVVTKILGLRPTEKDTRDKICLSFFISEEDVNLEKLMLNDGLDIYFIYWMADLKLIYDKNGTWDKFQKENSWINKYLPNLNIEKKMFKEYSFAWFLANFKKAIHLTFDRLETAAGKFQMKILPERIKEKMNKGTEVVVGDKILKMHVNDRREEYKNKFKSLSNKPKL